MKTENTVEVITTKHDAAFVADAKKRVSIENKMAAHVANIAEEMGIEKDADEPELKPLRAHLRALLERAGYEEGTSAVYASRLVLEFTGKEKGKARVTFKKASRDMGKTILASIEEKFPEADKAELVKALMFALKTLRAK